MSREPDPVGKQQALIKALQDPACYDHAVTDLQLLETHISWVILTGPYAYKIKKAVNFGFLDYSTLQRRALCCQEELRLNRRFAPDVYLGVVSIGGPVARPQLQAQQDVREYAVRMRQFDPENVLASLAARHALTADHFDALAQLLPGMQAQMAVADCSSPHGQAGDIHHWMMENFTHIEPLLSRANRRQQLAELRHWCETAFGTLETVLEQRRAGGFIREGHGDLHLGNLALIDGRVTPFDGIEFNEQLRWIDVISELAFLVMDLDDVGYAGQAWRVLNTCLQHSGDYGGLTVLRYYLVYRALVRAKVAVLRLPQLHTTLDREQAWYQYDTYLALATGYVSQAPPAVLLMRGVSGSGKSFYAARLAAPLSAIPLRSDMERKRLFGLAADARTGAGVQAGIYTAAAGERTYAALARLARQVIAAGYSAIVDATFLQVAQRDVFRRLADELGVPLLILHFQAEEPVLRQRVLARAAAGSDPSEAGLEVLAVQLQRQQATTTEERACTLEVNASDDADRASLDALLATMRQRLGR